MTPRSAVGFATDCTTGSVWGCVLEKQIVVGVKWELVKLWLSVTVNNISVMTRLFSERERKKKGID